MPMDNFFNYLMKPVNPEDVDLWFKINNIRAEKSEMFSDFFIGLYFLINDTYLGNNDETKETNIILTGSDNQNHFDWCWNKIINSFKEEKIIFGNSGDHYDYFLSFFMDMYYNQSDKLVKETIPQFIDELFDLNKIFTKTDLEMFTNTYKILEKNLKN